MSEFGGYLDKELSKFRFVYADIKYVSEENRADVACFLIDKAIHTELIAEDRMSLEELASTCLCGKPQGHDKVGLDTSDPSYVEGVDVYGNEFEAGDKLADEPKRKRSKKEGPADPTWGSDIVA